MTEYFKNESCLRGLFYSYGISNLHLWQIITKKTLYRQSKSLYETLNSEFAEVSKFSLKRDGLGFFTREIWDTFFRYDNDRHAFTHSNLLR